jgi:hypothetical protein
VKLTTPSSAKVEKGGTIPPLPILLYGVVPNEVSRGTTVALPFYLLVGYIHDQSQHFLPELSLELLEGWTSLETVRL